MGASRSAVCCGLGHKNRFSRAASSLLDLLNGIFDLSK